MFHIDKKYLPSKKFVQALSVAVVIIVIAILLSYWRPSFNSYKNTNAITSATSTINNIDSDNDGLPDWEESLYGTDPHNQDTNGDGTLDGEEVKENRDPLKANTATIGQKPNNYIDPDIIAANQKEIQDYENLNPTDKMARDITSDVIAAQPTDGSAIDQDTVNSIVNTTMQNVQQKTYTGSTTVSDLNLIPANQITQQSVTNYITQYFNVTENFRKIMNQDISVTSSAATTKMKSLINQYQIIVNDLIKMPIPAAADSQNVAYHLRLINDFEEIIQIDTDIISPNSDATSIYADLQSYNDTFDDLTTALETIDAAMSITRS